MQGRWTLRAKKTHDAAFVLEAIYKKGRVLKYPIIVNLLPASRKRFCFQNVV